MSKTPSSIFCVDIGGTSIKSGLLTDERVHNLQEIPTPSQGGVAILQVVADMVSLCPEAAAVGVSTAGEVDTETGQILLADNIREYTGLPVRDILQEKTRLPVAVENDVNAAAMGELYFGAAKKLGIHSFLMVSYGTGIGGAIIDKGAIFRGATGSAGEIGGLITHPEATVQGNVGSGSYERYASTSALVERIQRLHPQTQDGREVFSMREDAAVGLVMHRWIEEICYGLVGGIHLLNPQAVVLGGGIMREAYLYAALQKKIPEMLKESFRHTQILQSKLGNTAALYGAGVLAKAKAAIM